MSYDIVIHVKNEDRYNKYDHEWIEKANFNITYNYGHIYKKFWDSLYDFNEKPINEVLPILKNAMENLDKEGKNFKDHYVASEGNAKEALRILIEYCEEYPTGELEIY